jgi:hypothetical protein
MWLSALALAVAAVLWSGVAEAIVPPRDCGMIRVGAKRYNIKTDQLSCDRARRYSRHYLRTSSKPPRYRCTRYKNSSLVFRCVNSSANPDRTFFAIKR